MRTVAIGTDKGAWFLEQRAGGWHVDAPHFPGWKVTTFGTAPDGTRLAAVASNWFGPAIHARVGGGWKQFDEGPRFAEGGPRMNQIWTLHTAGDRIHAGVDEAGLFTSDDGATTWTPVPGLNEHATRADWNPGAGGLCAHRILTAGDQVWVGISAVGVFRSDDGGTTFVPRNVGVPSVNTVEGTAPPEIGYCVHSLTQDPQRPERIWRQDHRGVFRTSDGGDHWERIEEGLPAGFGFPIARDHASGRLFVAPLHSDERRLPVDGRFGVWRSDDDGDSWQRSGTGWSDAPGYGLVLRDAMHADQAGGVFVGTTSGEVWGTLDAGDTWARLPGTYPRITTVDVFLD